MSNESEYYQLLNNYANIASSLANGIGNYISSIYSGYAATGTETVGKVSQTPVKGIKLDATTLELTVGATGQLTATLQPEDATDQTVTWSSSNEGVVTVDQNGGLKAKAAGTANITVKTNDGGFTATCKVTVKPVAVTGITLDRSEVSMKVGDMIVLTPTIQPENATDQAVTWSSSNPTTVKVENGKLTALQEGTATITAKCGNKTATCTVTVQKADITAESVTLDLSSMELAVGGTARLTATVKPDEATVKTVQWSSSDDSVATVAADGTVTAVREGTATITAKCGEKSADCAVTVKAAAPVSPTSVTLDQNTLSLTVGGTAQLTATVAPENATDKTLSWNCDKLDIAEVSTNGTVTAKAAGTAIITVTTADGSLTATCTVTVTS